jgi:hypothetical protein
MMMNQPVIRKLTHLWPLNSPNWQNQVEDIRSRILFRSLDAALIAPLKPKKRVIAHLKTLLNPRLPNYEKVSSLVNLLDLMIAGSGRYISNCLFNASQLPFVDTRIELLSYGTGATVFLLKKNNDDKVLKIFRRSLGRYPKGIWEVVHSYKQKYETVYSWYNGQFNFVPRATFFVLHGPIFGSPAAAMLQPYIGGEKKDFFYDFSDQELIDLMRNNLELRQQFIFFAEQTLRSYESQRMCFDFIGKENLLLVKAEDHLKLVIIDIGIFELDKIESPAKLSQIETHVTRLRNLKELVQKEVALSVADI